MVSGRDDWGTIWGRFGDDLGTIWGRLRTIRVGTGGAAHKISQLSLLIRVRYFPIIDLAQ